MSLTFLRIAGAVLLFILIFATGYWVGHTGKPYNSGILTVHKLIGVAAAVLLGVTVYQVNKASGLSGNEIISIAVTGVLFLGTIVTGGLISADITLPTIVLRLHQIMPFLTLLSTGVTMFLLLHGT